VFAFVYSYAPLHRAKDWKIGYLEERLSIRTNQAKELGQKLREARASLEGTPSGEELGAVRAQLNEATSLADAHKKEITELSRKLESAERSRNKWKSRYNDALPELEAARRSTEAEAIAATTDPLGKTAPTAASEAARPGAVEPGPAAPASDADDEASDRDRS
jgi:chromosome segregation ATPase